MQLLHDRVEVTPGEPGARPGVWPPPDSQRLTGSAVLYIKNETALKQESRYEIRLRCTHPLCEDGYYTITSLTDPPKGGQPDEHGGRNEWLAISVAYGQDRFVLIQFEFPKSPEARAGVFQFQAVVLAQPVDDSSGSQLPTETLVPPEPATLVVHPFHEWSLDLTPLSRRAGRFFRRRHQYDVVITSESNDWLYCELRVPEQQDLRLSLPTTSLAVPPPERGELLPSGLPTEGRPGTQRRVPLRAATRLTEFRGDTKNQPIAVTGVRLEAPSLSSGSSPLSETRHRYQQTTETRPPRQPCTLDYSPPFPESWRDLTGQLVKIAAFVAIGIILILPLLLCLKENLLHGDIQITYVNGQKVQGDVPIKLLDAKSPVSLSGKSLVGSGIGVEYTLDGKTETKDLIKTSDAKSDHDRSEVAPKCQIDTPTDLVPSEQWIGTSGKLQAQRVIARLPFLTRWGLLPRSNYVHVQFGRPITLPGAPSASLYSGPGPYKPGDRVKVWCNNLGDKPLFTINGHVLDWLPPKRVDGDATARFYKVKLPDDVEGGEQHIHIWIQGHAITLEDTIKIQGKTEQPTVSSMRPTHGPASGGTTVTINGSGFGENGQGVQVLFEGSPPLSPESGSRSDLLLVTSPRGTAGNSVSVSVKPVSGDGPAVSAGSFRYDGKKPIKQKPTKQKSIKKPGGMVVDRVEPASGPTAVRKHVLIKGRGFGRNPNDLEVLFGDQPAELDRYDARYHPEKFQDNQIDAKAPPGAGTVKVTVWKRGKPIQSSAMFSYQGPVPGPGVWIKGLQGWLMRIDGPANELLPVYLPAHDYPRIHIYGYRLNDSRPKHLYLTLTLNPNYPEKAYVKLGEQRRRPVQLRPQGVLHIQAP